MWGGEYLLTLKKEMGRIRTETARHCKFTFVLRAPGLEVRRLQVQGGREAS